MRYYLLYKLLFVIFCIIFLIITFIVSSSHNHHEPPVLSFSNERCQNGRVCTNSCYSNGELIDCNEQNMLKTVLFNPPFSQIIPDIQLRLVQIHPDETIFNPDVTLRKENLTSYGMNIHFSLLKDSTVYVYCADWLACSSDKNFK